MRKLLSTLFLVTVAAQAAAQAFPEKPIRMVVHFPAGSTTDVIGRELAQHVAAQLKQPVIVDNKPGADGAIGALDVKGSRPDGYTILLATNSPMSGVPTMKKTPGYDVTKDFSPITDVGRYTFLLYVNSTVPATTLNEFVSLVKTKPKGYTYASGNVTGQLSFASVAQANKLEMIHVPYKGEPPAINDLMGGHVHGLVATAGTGVPHVRSGKLRALAVIADTRSPNLPDVPTIKEAGVPNFSIQPWVGLFGPAGMPKNVVDTLNKAFTNAMKDPEIQKKMAAQDFYFTPSTPEALGSLVNRQLDVHRSIAQAAGVQPE